MLFKDCLCRAPRDLTKVGYPNMGVKFCSIHFFVNGSAGYPEPMLWSMLPFSTNYQLVRIWSLITWVNDEIYLRANWSCSHHWKFRVSLFTYFELTVCFDLLEVVDQFQLVGGFGTYCIEINHYVRKGVYFLGCTSSRLRSGSTELLHYGKLGWGWSRGDQVTNSSYA